MYNKSLLVLPFSFALACTSLGQRQKPDQGNDREERAQQPVVEGGMSTGGGVLLGDAANPWFINNTTTVKYCVESDSSTFKVADTVKTDAITGALQFWKDAFRAANNSAYYRPGELEPYSKIEVAEQEFVSGPCNADTDIQIQFGKISDAQRDMIPNLGSVAAVAVRTAYDRPKLRGKGFIFVAPSEGPLAPKFADFSPDAWSMCGGCLLKRALMHEFGHVFGVGHSGSWDELMGERHLEFITRKAVIAAIKADKLSQETIENRVLPPPAIFGFPGNYTYKTCEPGSDAVKSAAFFGYTETLPCRSLEFDLPKSSITVKAADRESSSYTTVGRIELNFNEVEDETITRVHYSEIQQVFSKLPMESQATQDLFGPSRYRKKNFAGTYTSDDGKTSRKVFGHTESGIRFELIGEYNDLLQPIMKN